MHYIRFLKAPRVLPNAPGMMTAKVTVTTDLGESFLMEDTELVVGLEDESGRPLKSPVREYLWKGSHGMRSLEVMASITERVSVVRMFVGPKKEDHNIESFESVLTHSNSSMSMEDLGGVVAVRSMVIDAKGKKSMGSGLAERAFSSKSGSFATQINIWEETGESIARHIWDAGLVLSSYLSSLSQVNLKAPASSQALKDALPRLLLLENLLSQEDLKILELGAGCGIVGITLAAHFPEIQQILLTDLDVASEILEHNLSIFNPSSGLKVSHQVLDWEAPIPPNVKSINWDLVVVADCTYNPDVVPDLVNTLRSLVEINREATVLLAMKVRHESEMVFFDLMQEKGFKVDEKCKWPLPVLGGEEEEIEIFVFRAI